MGQGEGKRIMLPRRRDTKPFHPYAKANRPRTMRRDIGQASGPGEWFIVTQKLIHDYADLTGETGSVVSHAGIKRKYAPQK